MDYKNETKGNLIAMLESRDKLLHLTFQNNRDIAALHDKRCEEITDLETKNNELKFEIKILENRLKEYVSQILDRGKELPDLYHYKREVIS